MLILSKIKRNPGTFITMKDGTRYAFMPNDAGDHVAEVENPAHIERFLSIPEGFGIYSGEVIPEGVVAEAITQDGEGGQGSINPADGEGTGGAGEGEDDDAMPLEHMTEDDLKKLYQEELGRAPHWRAHMETLIEHIKEHREGAADQE